MPLCVHCAYPADHLYTTYRTKSNIRLDVCCDQFLDPLIEHDPLILLLDLILLKPRVFLHLLFNRDTPPLDATSGQVSVVDDGRHRRIHADLFKLFGTVILAETAVRLTHLQTSTWHVISHVTGSVIVETVSQHATTLLLTLALLRWRNWYPFDARTPSPPKNPNDGRQRDFMPSLVPLTLLYTSLLPLVLQLFLSIWYIPPSTGMTPVQPTALPNILPVDLDEFPALQQILLELASLWDNVDRVWAGTRLLGGMSAGFGLRVLLPTKPWETTAIVLAGWGVAGLAGRAMELVM